VRRGERVVVFGDYDCDGITATALLTETLRRLDTDVEPSSPAASTAATG
jgi:single-stranded-DNA-specific exonuclease